MALQVGNDMSDDTAFPPIEQKCIRDEIAKRQLLTKKRFSPVRKDFYVSPSACDSSTNGDFLVPLTSSRTLSEPLYRGIQSIVFVFATVN